MDMLETKNLGLVKNIHSNKHGRVHMKYEHGMTPEEKAATGADLSVGTKMQTEDGNYKKRKKGRPDLGCESDLEALTYAFFTRFGAEVRMHPTGAVNYGDGTIYNPDMLAVIGEGEKRACFFIEPHTVDNVDRFYNTLNDSSCKGSLRVIPGTVVNKALHLVAANPGAAVLIVKPNFYFQIVRAASVTPHLYPENESALCICTRCQTIFPVVLPAPCSCPLCKSSDIKIAFFGDQTETGAVSIKGNRPGTPGAKGRAVWYEGSECAQTTPVKGEIWDDLQFNDTYGTPSQGRQNGVV